MNREEKIVKEYLQSQGLVDILFEPDGNIPPDFLVNRKIAIEVRRLNQHYESNAGHKGLEEISIPLWQKLENFFVSLGPSIDGESWFVAVRYKRPVGKWKDVKKTLKEKLTLFRTNKDRKGTSFFVSDNFEIELFRAGKSQDTFFLLGAASDRDAGGWVLSEIARNLRLCIDEKTKKVQKYRYKYEEWWLIFVDQIGYGLNQRDQETFENEIKITHDWDKIILIDPMNPKRAMILP
ncbi:MAG: hypothetical protein HN390_10365 [Anaerolineae bacterium]|jgi:hypothetical protein|nr:hypothetical protein [Anaerolineae bacterium]MBT7189612.1 hypothetical protein [Anaerolineae bacterium]